MSCTASPLAFGEVSRSIGEREVVCIMKSIAHNVKIFNFTKSQNSDLSLTTIMNTAVAEPEMTSRDLERA